MAYALNINNIMNTEDNKDNKDNKDNNDNSQNVVNSIIDKKHKQHKQNLYKIVKKLETIINTTILNFYDNFYICESNLSRNILIENVNKKYTQLFNAITNTGEDYKTTQYYEDHIKFTTFITSEMNMIE